MNSNPEPLSSSTHWSNRLSHLWMIVFAAIVAGSFPVVSTITPSMDPVWC